MTCFVSSTSMSVEVGDMLTVTFSCMYYTRIGLIRNKIPNELPKTAFHCPSYMLDYNYTEMLLLGLFNKIWILICLSEIQYVIFDWLTDCYICQTMEIRFKGTFELSKKVQNANFENNDQEH